MSAAVSRSELLAGRVREQGLHHQAHLVFASGTYRLSRPERRRDFSNTPGGVRPEIMFPDPEYPVALGPQLAPRTIVTGSVSVNLLLPEIRASPWRISSACGTCVPEAPIDEHNQPGSREIEIRIAEHALWMPAPSRDGRLAE